jgi:hypothetical protein
MSRSNSYKRNVLLGAPGRAALWIILISVINKHRICVRRTKRVLYHVACHRMQAPSECLCVAWDIAVDGGCSDIRLSPYGVGSASVVQSRTGVDCACCAADHDEEWKNTTPSESKFYYRRSRTRMPHHHLLVNEQFCPTQTVHAHLEGKQWPIKAYAWMLYKSFSPY